MIHLKKFQVFISAFALIMQLARASDSEVIEILERPMRSNCAKMPDDPKKFVCKCTESDCDDLKFDWPTEPGSARLVETTRSGLRFIVTNLSATHNESDSLSTIRVDLNSKHQTILGFGGAFTDAATININSLSKHLSEKLLESYFGQNGLQYSFGRVPIAGSDFSTRAYSYDDTNHSDYNLTEWHLAPEDLEHKIPVIKRAREMVKNTGGELKLLASPWSPPKWMKTSKNFERGHLVDDDKIYRAYANYLIKFYRAYKEHGISFWGATVQNEPVAAYLPFYFFNSLQMSAQETIRLVAEHLGPALEAEGYTKENFKLMIGDDSLMFVNQQVSVLLDQRVLKYVSGFAFHWYTSALIAPYSSLSKLVDSVKDKVDFVMMSEACNGAMVPWRKHVDLGCWDRGEAYAVDIIEDMQRQTSAWIDWNLALDEQGGPNWSGNFVDSPIIVSKNKNEFYKQPMYYVLAHFSRFFRPKSVRVANELKNPYYFEKVMILSALNKESGHLVVTILNKATSVRKLKIRVEATANGEARELGPFQIEGKSINTVVYKL